MVEFVTDYPDYSYIPDPYYEGVEGFYLVLNMLENGCTNLLNQLEAEL
jgi:protein-tyrosine phosphatase